MNLFQADSEQSKQHVRELFWEYLQWANQRVNEAFNVNFDTAALVENDMQTLGKFSPPEGRLLLAEVEGQMAGIACMKKLADGICEVKRMYVRPAFRKRGIGRALLMGLIAEAKQIGYLTMRLDSAAFMLEAHALYRSVGFRDIGAYEGSEIPKEFQQHWVFMELSLV